MLRDGTKGARSSGREAALQMLFALELSQEAAETVAQQFWRELPGNAEGRPYADMVFLGVAGRLTEMDELLKRVSTNWRIERMVRVDRNVLRIAAWELSNQLDTPRAVIIDEAVELAKSFGTEDSGAFVNGLLDNLANQLGRFDDPAAQSPSDGANSKR